MYSRYIRFVIRHPVFMSLTILAITAVMATQIPRIRIDPELDSFIPAENDAQKNLDELEEILTGAGLLDPEWWSKGRAPDWASRWDDED